MLREEFALQQLPVAKPALPRYNTSERLFFVGEGVLCLWI